MKFGTRILTALIALPILVIGLVLYIFIGYETKSND